jgi:N-methylhydantoinase B
MEKTVLNGAELAILINRFEGIARKMTNTLYRTGRSGVLNRARDFSCCIVTADCQLLATADSLPIHVLVGPDMMAQAMKEFHPDLRRGDAFLHNSPYHGSSHAADHVLLIPVIDETGKHRFTVLTKAHQADCGNAEPTTYMGTAPDVYAEGALIFPAVRVQENYRTIEDVVRMCEMRIRVPEQWKGDFLAMIGSARIGEQEILRLGAEIGWDKLETFCGQWFDYSEQRMAARLATLPPGVASASSTHDPIPGTPPEGIRINATVTARPDEGRVTIDLRDNMDALPCGLNLSEACARSACLIALFNSIGGDVPRNAGSFRRVEILLKENSVAGIPVHPTSCSVSTTNVADRVTHSVALSIAQLGEGFGTAEFGAFIPPSSAVVSGFDPRTGDRFVNQIFLGCTTGAGTPFEDAWLTYLHVGNGGMCFIDSVELDELYQPILVQERRILANTEGAGRHIGAPSLRVEFSPVGCDIDVAYCSDGRINPPRGVHGGGIGGASNQFRRTKEGATEPLPAATTVRIHEGEAIISVCCGGGGYGSPTARDPHRVLKDMQDGWVTEQRARDVYKVIVNRDGTLDMDATRAVRERAGA